MYKLWADYADAGMSDLWQCHKGWTSSLVMECQYLLKDKHPDYGEDTPSQEVVTLILPESTGQGIVLHVGGSSRSKFYTPG